MNVCFHVLKVQTQPSSRHEIIRIRYNIRKTVGYAISLAANAGFEFAKFCTWAASVRNVAPSRRDSHRNAEFKKFAFTEGVTRPPACFGWVMGHWTGAPLAADRSDSSINIFQQPNKPWRHVTDSLCGDKRLHLKNGAMAHVFCSCDGGAFQSAQTTATVRICFAQLLRI
jgi:hypothetical protein